MIYIYNRVYDEDVFLYNEFIIFDDNNLPMSRKDKIFKQYTSILHKHARFVVDRMYSIIRAYDIPDATIINEYLSKTLGNSEMNFELMNSDGTALLINIIGTYDNCILRDGKLHISAIDYKANDTIYPNNVLERRLENINLLDGHITSYIKYFLIHSIDELISKKYVSDTFKLDINHNILNVVTDNILCKYLK